jgi:hypothetical protein
MRATTSRARETSPTAAMVMVLGVWSVGVGWGAVVGVWSVVVEVVVGVWSAGGASSESQATARRATRIANNAGPGLTDRAASV